MKYVLYAIGSSGSNLEWVFDDEPTITLSNPSSGGTLISYVGQRNGMALDVNLVPANLASYTLEALED